MDILRVPFPLCPYNKPKSTELSRVRHCHWTMCLYCRNLPVAVHRRRGRWLAASFLRIRYGLLGVVKIMIYNRAWCWRLRRPLQKRYLKHLPDPSTNASFPSPTISSVNKRPKTFENQISSNAFAGGRSEQHRPTPLLNRFMSCSLHSPVIHPSFTFGPLTITLFSGKLWVYVSRRVFFYINFWTFFEGGRFVSSDHRRRSLPC